MNIFNHVSLLFLHNKFRIMEFKISWGYKNEEVLELIQGLVNGMQRKRNQIKCLTIVLKLNILINNSSYNSLLLTTESRKCKKQMQRVNLLPTQRQWNFLRIYLNLAREQKRMWLRTQGDNLINKITFLFQKILHRIIVKMVTLFQGRIITNNNMNLRLIYLKDSI